MGIQQKEESAAAASGIKEGEQEKLDEYKQKLQKQVVEEHLIEESLDQAKELNTLAHEELTQRRYEEFAKQN